MKTITLDKYVLQIEINRLVLAVDAYLQRPPENAGRLSSAFSLEDMAVHRLLYTVIDAFRPEPDYYSVDILNRFNSNMIDNPAGKIEFKDDAQCERFYDLCSRTYKHELAIGFFGQRDAYTAAKQALHDFIDAFAIYHGGLEREYGLDVTPEVVERFRNIAHNLVKAEEAAVVEFQPRLRRS